MRSGRILRVCNESLCFPIGGVCPWTSPSTKTNVLSSVSLSVRCEMHEIYRRKYSFDMHRPSSRAQTTVPKSFCSLKSSHSHHIAFILKRFCWKENSFEKNALSSKKFKTSNAPRRLDSCPFCPGNEHMTPPPLLQIPDGLDITGNKPHEPQQTQEEKETESTWKLRVVENKYPAVVPITTIEASTAAALAVQKAGVGLHTELQDEFQIEAVGHHEVGCEAALCFKLTRQGN